MKFEAHINCSPMMDKNPFEVVERKGLGHPDTICDLLTERVSFDLANYYLKTCGSILHYNVDKALLVAGTSEPQFLGGKILEPVRLYLGDRATNICNGKTLALDELIDTSICAWLNENLRYLKLGDNFEWKNQIKQGSTTLSLVEERHVANDISVGVGYWPLSSLEKLVLEIEGLLNSKHYKQLHPELGEDIKVMAIRHGNVVDIILACAIVDKYISSISDYSEKKQLVIKKLHSDLAAKKYLDKLDLSFSFNALDDLSLGKNGLYLTVTGLSCEGADSGQVGRGNRVKGLISFMRPQTMEAWAGKNFKTHVGKIYSFAAFNLARELVHSVEEINEATVTLVGKIGSPVEEPVYVFCDFKTQKGDAGKIKTKVLDTLRKIILKKNIFVTQQSVSA